MIDYARQLDATITSSLTGRVVRTEGMSVSVAGLPAPVGAVVAIDRQTGGHLEAEVVGFRQQQAVVYPLGELSGIRHGSPVRLAKTSRTLPVGQRLLGRVINAHGQAIDGLPQPALMDRTALHGCPPSPIERPRIETPLATGIRALDGLLTCGRGQRMGIFSGAGVGKSVLMGMMARSTTADVSVIGLIGERGREVGEFLQRDLGPQGLRRSVVVVATSDQPALLRVHAAQAATAIAEYFRDRGHHVLLMMDSVTRFAAAQREIGLAAGEPPATRGYPPSVFASLPRLLERAGSSPRGSITGFYSVLVEGDDPNEPISDAVRSLLDGHTVLSRRLASAGHYPAIDLLQSISRSMNDIVPANHLHAALHVRRLLAAYREHEDLISVGAYRSGSNPLVDKAIASRHQMNEYLRQSVDESADLDESRTALLALAEQSATEQDDRQPLTSTPER